MNVQKLLLPALAAFLAVSDAGAQTKTGTKPAAATAVPGGIKKITSVEGITEYELANGMRVLLFPDASKPTITTSVTYKVGSRNEGYGETGMAHLLEHMVFKGTPKHPNIPAELTAHGASPNGTTSYDRTNYFETFAATDENLNWSLDMEADRMINSYIAQKDLQSEFTVVRNEFESGENSPSNILMERILASAYIWHNYGNTVIGSKEDIERVPIENLQAFYKKYYQPDNAVVLVAGKIDEAQTLALVNKYFGKIPRPARKLQMDYTVEPVQDGERFVELRRSGDVQAVAQAYHIAPGAHPDYAAMDVLNEALTSEPNGRLYQSLVKSGKAASVWSWAAGLRDPGFLYINADVPKEKSIDSVRMIMNQTLADIRTKPVTEEEVNRGKTKLLKDFETLYRNTARVGIGLSEFIGQGDWRLGYLYRDQLKKVTAADVNRVANLYLKGSNRTSGIFVPATNAERTQTPVRPDIAKMLDGYKGEAAMAAGEAFDPTPDNIDKRTEVGSMTSGAKYALLRKDTRGNTVDMRLTLRLGDEGSLQGKSTLAEVTAAALRRGTKNKSMAQINDALDKLQSNLSISGSGQTVAIRLQSTKQNFGPALDILDEILHQPALSNAELTTMRDEAITALEQERSEPESIAGRELTRTLNNYPKGHVRYPMNVDEEVTAMKAVSFDEVRKFHQDFYNGSAATVAVVGDFDVDDTKKKLTKMLGDWSAIKGYSYVPDAYYAAPAKVIDIKTPDKKNAMMMAGTNLKMREDNPDYPALTMANFVFGGGFLNSRLATRIRQKEGLSYGVGSYLQASSLDETSAFGAYAIYNPDVRQKVMDAYKDELQKLVRDGITEDELKAAKSGLLQYRQTGRAQDAQLAAKLSSNLYLNRTMAWDKQMDDKLQALTVADVNTAIRKYFNPATMSFVMAGDFK
ncbi:MAG: insulinase family protein [Sphingobacteriales bacterium]|nr:MAG: insulinase family protein [Sphingobacteriales bacterium]